MRQLIYRAMHQSDDLVVEIVSGLKPGDAYVSKGSFEIKATLVTGSLGDHAGHGH